jgi:glycine dehydrogenase
VRDALKRSLPGRIVGLSVDSRGMPAYRLALQTREQHIRREKATSNICTAQVLLAVIASMYAVYHGPEGLSQIARNVHRRAAVLAAGLRKLGFTPTSENFFDTLSVDAGAKRAEIVARAAAEKINFGVGDGSLRIALDETTTPATVEAVWRAFGGELAYAEIDATTREALPEALKRTTAFLTHPVFHAHRSETEMLRYMRKLSDRDLALDRAMIPLGSCTMKLNATTEMMPLTWQEFSSLHPFAPREQAAGYHALFARLEKWLCDITGYDAISLQPNSGAQGEYAGLLAMRRAEKRTEKSA